MTAASLADRELHTRLLRGDPVAPAILAEQFLEPVVRAVTKRVARAYSTDVAFDMAVDAIFRLGQHPERYDPERSGLQAYLVLDATYDAKNAARREDRRQFSQSPIDDVELLAQKRNMYSAGPEDLLFREDAVTLPAGMSRDDALAAINRAFPDERDRKALQLMGARERRTSAYARIFGIEHLDPETQRNEVKRQKDRITVKRKRLLKKIVDSSTPPAGG